MLSFYEGFEFNFLLRVCPIYCIYTEVHVPQHVCGGHRTTLWSQFWLSISTRVPEMEFRPLVLPAPFAFCFTLLYTLCVEIFLRWNVLVNIPFILKRICFLALTLCSWIVSPSAKCRNRVQISFLYLTKYFPTSPLREGGQPSPYNLWIPLFCFFGSIFLLFFGLSTLVFCMPIWNHSPVKWALQCEGASFVFVMDLLSDLNSCAGPSPFAVACCLLSVHLLSLFHKHPL